MANRNFYIVTAVDVDFCVVVDVAIIIATRTTCFVCLFWPSYEHFPATYYAPVSAY